MFLPYMITVAIALSMAAIVLAVNPQRKINQLFAVLATAGALWLICILWAMSTEASNANLVPGVVACNAIGAFVPLILWLLKAELTEDSKQPLAYCLQLASRSLATLFLLYLVLRDDFIIQSPVPSKIGRGTTYFIFVAVLIGLIGVILARASVQFKKLTGIRRLELQFLLVNAALAISLASVFGALGNALHNQPLRRVSPIFSFALLGVAAWGITTRRVLYARQLFLSFGQKFITVVFTCGLAFGINLIFNALINDKLSVLLSIALALPTGLFLDGKISDWLLVRTRQRISAAKLEFKTIAQNEPDPLVLTGKCEEKLAEWNNSPCALVLPAQHGNYVSEAFKISTEQFTYTQLWEHGWVTPESLGRVRQLTKGDRLPQFLVAHNIAAIVAVQNEDRTPTLLLTFKVRENRRPFTYPEVLQIKELAETIENLVIRARLVLQTRQADQLAIIGQLGASIAHEIRNPLDSIKTFARLASNKGEDPEFVEKFAQLIPQEVDRIDKLTQQLLELAKPRKLKFQPLDINS